MLDHFQVNYMNVLSIDVHSFCSTNTVAEESERMFGWYLEEERSLSSVRQQQPAAAAHSHHLDQCRKPSNMFFYYSNLQLTKRWLSFHLFLIVNNSLVCWRCSPLAFGDVAGGGCVGICAHCLQPGAGTLWDGLQIRLWHKQVSLFDFARAYSQTALGSQSQIPAPLCLATISGPWRGEDWCSCHCFHHVIVSTSCWLCCLVC